MSMIKTTIGLLPISLIGLRGIQRELRRISKNLIGSRISRNLLIVRIPILLIKPMSFGLGVFLIIPIHTLVVTLFLDTLEVTLFLDTLVVTLFLTNVAARRQAVCLLGGLSKTYCIGIIKAHSIGVNSIWVDGF